MTAATHTRKPEPRFDMQGEMPEAERVERAMKSFVKDFGRTAALYMESCIHCGMCAEACHFYEVTKDPKYTPIHKLEPLRRVWQQEYTLLGRLAKLVGLAKPVTDAELAESVAKLVPMRDALH